MGFFDNLLERSPAEPRRSGYFGPLLDYGNSVAPAPVPAAPRPQAPRPAANVPAPQAGGARGMVNPPPAAREDVPEMTLGSVLRDGASGVLKVGPTAVKGAADLIRMMTGDALGKDLSDFMQDRMDTMGTIVGSERAAAQRTNFERDMKDPDVGIRQAVLNNKGAIADQLLPSLGSMLLPAGAANAATRLVMAGKAAASLDKVALAARVARVQLAAGIGATAAQNAAEVFTNLLDKGHSLEQAYTAAGISVPFSVLAGKLFGGGAEAALLRQATRQTPAQAVKAGAVGVAKAGGRGGGQETVEEFGQIAGEAGATQTMPNLTNAGKRLAVSSVSGFATDGGMKSAGHANDAWRARGAKAPSAAPLAPPAPAPTAAPAAPRRETTIDVTYTNADGQTITDVVPGTPAPAARRTGAGGNGTSNSNSKRNGNGNGNGNGKTSATNGNPRAVDTAPAPAEGSTAPAFQPIAAGNNWSDAAAAARQTQREAAVMAKAQEALSEPPPQAWEPTWEQAWEQAQQQEQQPQPADAAPPQATQTLNDMVALMDMAPTQDTAPADAQATTQDPAAPNPATPPATYDTAQPQADHTWQAEQAEQTWQAEQPSQPEQTEQPLTAPDEAPAQPLGLQMWPTDSATEAMPEPLLALPLHTPELPPLEQAFAQTGQGYGDGYGYSYSPTPAFEAPTQPWEQSAQSTPSASSRNNNAIHSSDYSLISDSLQALAQEQAQAQAQTQTQTQTQTSARAATPALRQAEPLGATATAAATPTPTSPAPAPALPPLPRMPTGVPYSQGDTVAMAPARYQAAPGMDLPRAMPQAGAVDAVPAQPMPAWPAWQAPARTQPAHQAADAAAETAPPAVARAGEAAAPAPAPTAQATDGAALQTPRPDLAPGEATTAKANANEAAPTPAPAPMVRLEEGGQQAAAAPGTATRQGSQQGPAGRNALAQSDPASQPGTTTVQETAPDATATSDADATANAAAAATGMQYSRETGPARTRAQTASTTQGTPAPASQGTTQTATIQSVQAALNTLVGPIGRLRLGRGGVVVTTSERIQPDWEPLVGKVDIGSEETGRVKGFYDPDSKTVFLIADHIQAGHEVAVAAHELMHKHGKAVLGEAKWKHLHETLGTWANKPQGSLERQVHDEAVRRMEAARPADAQADAQAEVQENHRSEELFPYAVEVAVELGIQPIAMRPLASVAGWLARVRASLQATLNKLTNNPQAFDGQDLVDLAFGIAQRERAGAATGQWQGDVAWAKGGSESPSSSTRRPLQMSSDAGKDGAGAASEKGPVGSENNPRPVPLTEFKVRILSDDHRDNAIAMLVDGEYVDFAGIEITDDGPILSIEKSAKKESSKEYVRIDAHGVTEAMLKAVISYYVETTGSPPIGLPGSLADDNRKNFRKEFDKHSKSNHNGTVDDWAQAAIRDISFGKARQKLGYGVFEIELLGSVNVGDLKGVPKEINVIARRY